MSYYGKIDGGFSFNEVPIADYNLEYAPESGDTYVWRPTESNIHQQTFDGHDGGYYYGATKQPKKFALRCYYDGQYVTAGLMNKIFFDFKIGAKGKLVFDRRPWLYYNVVITGVDDRQMFNYLNGIVVINCICYEGYGHTDLMFNPYTDPTSVDYKSIVNNSFLLSESEMDNYPTVLTGITSTRTINLWNPGTAKTKLKITYSGTSSKGINITNLTTDQICSMNKSSGSITVDGNTGKTYNGGTLALQYHYEGFIELDPKENTIRIAPRDGGTINLSSMEFIYNPAFD